MERATGQAHGMGRTTGQPTNVKRTGRQAEVSGFAFDATAEPDSVILIGFFLFQANRMRLLETTNRLVETSVDRRKAKNG